jgi:hypothetical protein
MMLGGVVASMETSVETTNLVDGKRDQFSGLVQVGGVCGLRR